MRLEVLSKLSTGQRSSLIALLLLLLILPVGLIYTLNPKSFGRSRAQVAAPPINTPISGENAFPQITTSSLRNVKMGVFYKFSVEAQDNNGDYMEMNFSGLPTGLTKGACQFGADPTGRSNYICEIIGTPEVAGSFSVRVSVTDEQIATSVKNLPLTILP